MKRILTVCGLVLCLFVFAHPALANHLTGATATVDCNGFTLTVNAAELTPSTSYTIDFTFTLTPTSGPLITVPGTIDFVATSSTATEMASGTWPGGPLAAKYTVTGSAVLTASSSTVPITINGSSSVVLNCGGTGCPATIGFWKNQKKHPFPDSVQTSGLTIGGVTYSASDLLTILNNNGGNAVAILGKQLVGALLNLAAGAKHNATADGAITTAETLLQTNNLNLLTSVVAPSTALGQALLAPATVLDGYNSSDFNTCSEGTGLILDN
jgi:hypothetical protein